MSHPELTTAALAVIRELTENDYTHADIAKVTGFDVDTVRTVATMSPNAYRLMVGIVFKQQGDRANRRESRAGAVA